MRTLFAALTLVAVATAPAAGASVFDGDFTLSRIGSPVCSLGDRVAAPAIGAALCMLDGAPVDVPDVPKRSAVRSPMKEGAASFLLPGLGQMRMGRSLSARIYFALEGATWVAIGSFLWQGYAREAAYKDYAVAFAGISGTSHSDDYYEKIAAYMRSDGPGGYNEYVRREAREYYYTDPDAMNDYYEANAIVGEDAWRWESEKTFRRYNDLRDGSRSSYRRALYTGFFALALRVVSSVDAVRLAKGWGHDDGSSGEGVSMKFEHRRDAFLVSVTKPF